AFRPDVKGDAAAPGARQALRRPRIAGTPATYPGGLTMPRTNRLPRLAAVLLAGLAAMPAQAGPAAARELPHTYVVSRAPGVLPEGIAIDRDGTMYVSSDGTGALYRGDVRDTRLRPF